MKKWGIMQKNKVICLMIVLVLLLLILFSQWQAFQRADALVIFHTKDGSFHIACQIADDDQSRKTGLLNVDFLEHNKGMLFVYKTAEPRVFTMKNMNIPLDIIFIDQNLTVIKIVEANIGDEYIKSIDPAQYVVEINQGIANKYSIEIGLKVEIKF